MKSFLDLGLCDALLQAIGEQGYENPMPVQEEVIPFLLEKQVSDDESAVPRDLIALARGRG